MIVDMKIKVLVLLSCVVLIITAFPVAAHAQRQPSHMLLQFLAGSLMGIISGPVMTYLGVWPIPHDLQEWCSSGFLRSAGRLADAYVAITAVTAAAGVLVFSKLTGMRGNELGLLVGAIVSAVSGGALPCAGLQLVQDPSQAPPLHIILPPLLAAMNATVGYNSYP